MGIDRNSTLTIVTKTENKGLRVVIGAAILYLWLRWWWTGSLFATVASAVPPQVDEGQFGSVTGTLLPIVIDLLGFVGSIVISGFGLGWSVLWDMVSGLLETLGLWRKQEAATQAAIDSATQNATISAIASGSIAAGKAVVFSAAAAPSGPAPDSLEPVRTYSKPIPKRRIDLEKVAAALQSQDTELDDLDKLLIGLRQATEAELLAIRKVLNVQTEINESATDRLTKLEVAEEGTRDALTGFMRETLERLGKLEQSTIKKPPTRKATRQAPAKRSTKA